MAIPPTEPPSQAAILAQKAAAQAERDADARIALARKRVQEAEAEATLRLDQIRDGYNRDSEMERARGEVAIENARNKGYEVVRNSQQAYGRELSRVENQAKSQLQEREGYYRQALFDTEKRGRAGLNELELKQAQLTQFEDDQGRGMIEASRKEQQERLQALHDQNESIYAKESKGAVAERNRMLENQLKTTEQAAERHENQYRQTVTESQKLLENLQNRAARQLAEYKEDSTRRLTAYASRNEDPFYQLLDLGARMHETDDSFVLTARIPEHERSHLSVSVRGNEILLQGHRRNDDSQELGPGQTRRTSSFQAYSESFPLRLPVEARAIQKRFEGETLIVEIPKKTTYSRDIAKAPVPAERARAERPRFPDNLPITETGQDPRKQEDPAGNASQSGSNGSPNRPLA